MLRDTANIFLLSLKAPPIQALAKNALHNQKRKTGSRWCVDSSISPKDLYTYLKARFGPPNGLTTLFRKHSTDNFVQWHYTLLSGDNIVEVWGFNTRTELWIAGYPNLTDKDWSALVAAIKIDFRNYGKQLKEIRASLEHWSLFYNPYCRLNGIVSRLKGDLEKLDLDNLELPPQPPPFEVIIAQSTLPADDIGDFARQLEKCGRIYADAQVHSASLRTLTPVWAESFINLLIFVLAKTELKEDQRLYDGFRRQEIDIRVKLLHLNCDGFSKKIDSAAFEFKEFHRLMNERNDILHGNTEPKKLAFREVYFDDMIPLFPENLDFSTSVLRHSMVGIEAAKTLENIRIVENFIEFVLGHLKPDIKTQLKQIMAARDLGWREETKRVGLLFSESIGEGYLRIPT